MAYETATKTKGMGRVELQRIVSAFDDSRKRLEPWRRERRALVESYSGGGPIAQGAGRERSKSRPINLLEMAISIYRRHVAVNSPQCLIVPRHARLSLEPVCSSLEIATNDALREIGFEETLVAWVLEAMFGLGIVKCGLAPRDPKTLETIVDDPGQPFAHIVDYDDFCYDAAARRWETVQFMADRYSLPYDEAMETGMFGKLDVQPATRSNWNEGGDERTSSMGPNGEFGSPDESMPVVECWDLWLPFKRKVLRFVADDDGGLGAFDEPFAEIEWDGGEEGPYHRLQFGETPGSTMPLPPSRIMHDLNELANRVMRKLSRQSDRQKSVGIVDDLGEETAENVQQADDGDLKRGNPRAIAEVRMGGIDGPQLAFLLQIKELFSMLGGNLDNLGGLSPQADTLGQEQILKEGSSLRVIDMQKRTTGAVSKLVRQVAQYIYEDPVTIYHVEKPVLGTSISVSSEFSPEMREADFLDLNVDVVPFSMQDRAPAERLQSMDRIVQQVLLPAEQSLAAQGMAINWRKYLSFAAKYTNITEINDLVVDVMTGLGADQGGDPMAEKGDTGKGGKPSSTRREYVRRNIPGAGRSGKDSAMTSLMMGQRRQPAEMASIGRPTG